MVKFIPGELGRWWNKHNVCFPSLRTWVWISRVHIKSSEYCPEPIVHPIAWEVERENFQHFWLARLSTSAYFRVMKRPYSKYEYSDWRMISDINHWPQHPCSYIQVHTCTYTQSHIPKKTISMHIVTTLTGFFLISNFYLISNFSLHKFVVGMLRGIKFYVNLPYCTFTGDDYQV